MLVKIASQCGSLRRHEKITEMFSEQDFLWHNHTYWLRSKHPGSLIELRGVVCLWMADAGSKLKASVLSEMVNVSKEDLLNPWGSALTPVRKSRQLEWIVLFLSSLCMQMCSEGESASWETQQDLPQKKA